MGKRFATTIGIRKPKWMGEEPPTVKSKGLTPYPVRFAESTCNGGHIVATTFRVS